MRGSHGSCASVCREDNWRDQTRAYNGSDAHVANCGLEYIVFKSARIIPVYIIHIDWGQENTAHFESLPAHPTQYAPTAKKTHPRLLQDVRWPGEIARPKAAIYARASRYFSCGYGPSTGGRFVVEDVAELDDDEEEYGGYQAYRGEEVQDRSNIGFWSWVKDEKEEHAARERADLEDVVYEYVSERMGSRQGGDMKREYVPGLLQWDDISLPLDHSLTNGGGLAGESEED